MIQLLAEIEPPADLKDKILAGAREANHSGSNRWTRRRVLAAAAAVSVAAVGSWAWFGQSRRVRTFRKDMVRFLKSSFDLDYRSGKESELRAWLSKHHGVTGLEVPPGLASYRSLGCEVIGWKGDSAYLICFAVQGQTVHLFYLPGGGKIEGAPSMGVAEYATVGKDWNSATWVAGADLYLLATLGSKDLLEDVIPL